MNPDLLRLYDLLKSDYPLKLTHAFEVDDGFSEDFPLLYGKHENSDFWLYDYCSEWVFSYSIDDASYRGHTHPQDLDEAKEYICDFMMGKWYSQV